MSSDMTLGRLLERAEATARSLDRVENRAIERLDRIDGRLEAMNRKLTTIAKAQASPPVSRLERRLKDLAGYLIPLAVLWATGSVESAIELFKALR